MSLASPLAIVAQLALASCAADEAPAHDPARLRLWHTFSPRETKALIQALAGDDIALAPPRPLQRHPAMTLIFDALTPGAEARAGEARARTRLLTRHGLDVHPPAPRAGGSAGETRP